VSSPEQPVLRADLVLEGGGVKGVALAGAIDVLATRGYAFPRVAGSSAGAVVACLVAALQAAGEPVSRLEELVRSVDYRRFRDESRLGSLPLVGRALALLAQDGLYEGQYLEDFLTGALGELGVRTFGDLRIPAAEDPRSALPAGKDYRLVVTASDLSRRRLVRLPWDLPAYGADPDDYPVARAVRASAAIPFFFQPVRQRSPTGTASWVDGGLLSTFPVGLFDRGDSLDPRWPTFGVRLSARPGSPPTTRPVRGPLAVGLAAVEALLLAQDTAYVEEPCTVARTVFVPTEGVSPVDFDLSRETQQELWERGRRSAQRFLARWDFPAYVATCRRGLGVA
jgi:NTE family protein